MPEPDHSLLLDHSVLLVLGAYYVAFILLGLYVAEHKGRSYTEALIITFLFGPFGVLILALLPTIGAQAGTTITQVIPAATAAGPTPPPIRSARRPTSEDLKHLIDWSKVKTPEDEARVKREALVKYLGIYGGKLTDIKRQDGLIRFKCECGRPIAAEPGKIGMPVECPACRDFLLIPDPDA